jgi:hypothetical protein
MKLIDLTDILDHLEASGNVPYGFSNWGDRGWRFQGRPLWSPFDDIALALCSLCHTIEGVLMREGWVVSQCEEMGGYWCGHEIKSDVFADPSRLAAAAAAYRAQFNMEQL